MKTCPKFGGLKNLVFPFLSNPLSFNWEMVLMCSLDLMRELFLEILLLSKQTCHLVALQLLAQHFCQNLCVHRCLIL